jgi:protein tyrosine phosphatase (PTP) superfamily phosphohydrolase (DUF442 family)
MRRCGILTIILMGLALLCAHGQTPQPRLVRIANDRLPNAYRIAETVISGGQPEGDQAFADLAALGVKTVISVDGAQPNVELARKHGLRYVHLPHGYDGIPAERVRELAKAVRDLPGPIYIHCHHGRHRSPAAAAVACVSAGLIGPESALAVLATAGTSPNYRGLYQSAKSAQRLDDKLLDELRPEFPETASLPPIADAMVQIERTHEHLRALAANKWKRLTGEPDLDPPHEALLLKEHYRELLRTDDVKRHSAEFRKLLADAERGAAVLEEALEEALEEDHVASQNADRAFVAVTKSCSNCHRKFRDVPLSGKRNQ